MVLTIPDFQRSTPHPILSLLPNRLHWRPGLRHLRPGQVHLFPPAMLTPLGVGQVKELQELPGRLQEIHAIGVEWMM